MVLISLPKSKSADTGTDFFQKMMGYRMHATHARFGFSFLLSSPSLPFPAVCVVSTASFLVQSMAWRSSKLTLVFWPLETLGGIMSLLVIVLALDLENIFYFHLHGAGVNTHCRGVVTATLSLLAPSTSRTSLLAVLIFLQVGGGSLLSGKGLFSTKCVSRRGVDRLILLTGVFPLLFSGLVPSGTS